MSNDIDDVVARLSEVQRKMVGDGFYIDGWHNRRFLNDAIGLREMGCVTECEGGDDQHTTLNYEPTTLGRAVRARIQEQNHAE